MLVVNDTRLKCDTYFNYAKWNSNVVWLSVKSSQMENLLFMDLIYRQRTNFPLNEVCLKLHLTCKITSFHAFACGIKYHSGILLFDCHDYKKGIWLMDTVK